jgi:AcrR family transcriptional regulator
LRPTPLVARERPAGLREPKENVIFSLVAQRQKAEVRESFVMAAASLFAEVGYETATMAAIAERASSSIGNLYKYFAGKEDIFAAVLPAEFAEHVRRLTEARIDALGGVRDIHALPPNARYHVLAGDLLDVCLAHRERVIILLDRAEGTPFAGFAVDFRDKLVAWALRYARKAWPSLRPTASLRFALETIYEHFLRGLARAFAAFRDERSIRAAVAHLTTHHQGGLKHLFEIASAPAGPSSDRD